MNIDGAECLEPESRMGQAIRLAAKTRPSWPPLVCGTLGDRPIIIFTTNDKNCVTFETILEERLVCAASPHVNPYSSSCKT